MNPYDIEHWPMPSAWRSKWIPRSGAAHARMRQVVNEHNVYRWAGNLITELCGIRVEKPGKAVAR